MKLVINMYNLKYLYMTNKEMLIATLVEDNNLVAYHDNGSWYLFEETLEELKLNNTIEEISEEDVFVITWGVFPHRLFKENGYPIYEEPVEVIEDTLKHFLLEFKEYAIDDYTKSFHNKDKSLKYSAIELDEHYDAGYVSFFEEYYEEYLERKEEFDFISVEKVENDYLIVFNPSIVD